MVTARLHDQQWRDELLRAVSAMSKSTRSSLRLEGNMLGRELAARVKPFGFPASGAVGQKLSIAGEIDKLYYGRDDVFNSIRRASGVMMARGWYRELMGGRPTGKRRKRATLTAKAAAAREGDILEAQGLARRWGGGEMASIEFAPFDPGLHQPSRDGRGHVVRRGLQMPIKIPKNAAKEAFIRTKQQLAGQCKAAWLRAAQMLGGRIRMDGGVPREYQPGSHRAVPCRGAYHADGRGARVTLHNMLAYSSEAFLDGQTVEAALLAARERYQKAVREKAARALKGRRGGLAALGEAAGRQDY